jgi:spore photoproduct lyase
LSHKVKKTGFIEIILMTYSYIHNAINAEAFPGAMKVYDHCLMTGRGRGKYSYRPEVREEAEDFLRNELEHKLGNMKILYVS